MNFKWLVMSFEDVYVFLFVEGFLFEVGMEMICGVEMCVYK